MAIVLNGTTGITAPNVSGTTGTFSGDLRCLPSFLTLTPRGNCKLIYFPAKSSTVDFAATTNGD